MMKIVILALYFIKLTTSYNIYNRNNEFINNNLNPLNIYSYVSDDDHSNYILQDVNNVPQINDIRIVKMDSRDEDNLRHFSYETSDGTKREEKIRLIDQIDDNGEINLVPSVSGSSQYVSQEGYIIQNHYTASNNGYLTRVSFGKNIRAPLTKNIESGHQKYYSASPVAHAVAPGFDKGDKCDKIACRKIGVDGNLIISLIG